MMRMKEKTEVKKNIDEMAGKLFDYINAACEAEEADNRMMELALGFMTATVDMDEPIDTIKVELRNKLIYSYMFQMEEVIRYKRGNHENVAKEFKRD